MSSIVRQIVESDVMVRELMGQRRRRFRKPKKQRHPDALIRSYRAELVEVLEQTKKLVDAHLVVRLPELQRLAGSRVDESRDDIDTFSQVLSRIFKFVRGLLPQPAEARRSAEQAAQQTARFNITQVRSQFRGVLGIDVFFNEPRLQATLEDFAEENAKLIESISTQFLDEVESLVRRALRSGRRASDMAEEITQRFGVARSRAELIARDQIGKLNANLTRDRQQALGIEEYIWRTSRDERVRPTHQRLDGTRHNWDNPPSVGGRRVHPGEDFRCRCTAEPVIPGAPPPRR